MNLQPVLYVVGVLLSILSLSMIFPLMVDLYNNHSDWQVFTYCIIVTGFFAGALVITNHNEDGYDITVREGFLLVFFSWLSVAIFASIPFYMSGLELSYTDSFFEAMSGITTTGSTVIPGLSEVPPGLLLWRAILEWLGGIGIILMAMAILPFLKVGGMQIFRTELSEEEKVMPRITQLATMIGAIYFILTVISGILYMAAGMTPFNALAHALTTISTGGFSTFNESFAHYDTMYKELICMLFMVLGGLPFVLYIKALGGNFRPFIEDQQVRGFISLIIFITLMLSSYLVYTMDEDIFEAIRRTSFNVISIMTGTGFASADYSQWGSFATATFFFLMVVGACAGSTSCAIKVFRFQILWAVISVQFKRLIYPNGVFIPYYNGKRIPEDVPVSVMSFFLVYALCFVFLSLGLSYVGLDFITATSGALTAISNVGPGLGPIIGPAGNFQSLPDAAKWILSFGMLIGRLEIFTILVLLTPQFWRH